LRCKAPIARHECGRQVQFSAFAPTMFHAEQPARIMRDRAVY
jgi:hypothetical protein